MPRVRRRGIARHEDLNAFVACKLLTGHWWGALDGIEEPDDAFLKAAWEANREYLLDVHLHGVDDDSDEGLAFWLQGDHDHLRPWAWWRWSAPEPRRQITPGPSNAAGSVDWFGMPSLYKGYPPEFETERDYLERLNLLLPEE